MAATLYCVTAAGAAQLEVYLTLMARTRQCFGPGESGASHTTTAAVAAARISVLTAAQWRRTYHLKDDPARRPGLVWPAGCSHVFMPTSRSLGLALADRERLQMRFIVIVTVTSEILPNIVIFVDLRCPDPLDILASAAVTEVICIDNE